MQPSLFISHGAPDIAIVETPAHIALLQLSRQLEKPDAIVIASAHFETAVTEVVSDRAPKTMYDFGGFDPRLRQMVYAAPGSENLAEDVFQRLETAGISCQINRERSYDHGVWTPLILAYPEADIPVVQVSIQPEKDAVHHFAIGQALRTLREKNILVIGSGHITHNLREVFSAMQGHRVHPESKAKVDDFVVWISENLKEGDVLALLDWRKKAPNAVHNHPTSEHFMPFFVAYGAGCVGVDKAAEPTLMHRSTQFDIFTSDIWRFD
jgi:4,5-DOPA dioxygenase extradiol